MTAVKEATMKSALAMLVLAAVLMPGTPAVAGIADSPLPVLVAGQTTQFLYSVPGVVDFGALSTFFFCTSTDTAAQQVGVDIFAQPGGPPCNDAGTTSVSVPPGFTVIFGTGTPANEIIGANGMSLVAGCGSFPTVARILSTSKKLVCTAFVGDRASSPPATSWQLPIIAKLKQRAAN